MKIQRLQVYAMPLVLASLAGCTVWPSSWRLGGTPNQREAKAATKVAAAQGDLDAAAQRAVHQTGEALSAVSDQLSALQAVSDQQSAVSQKLGTRNAETGTSAVAPALAAARDFNHEAQALLDQAHGAPAAADEAAWRKVVAEVLAGDTRSRDAQAGQIADLSSKLRRLEDAHARTLEEVKREAEENTFWSDLAHKTLWIAIGLGLFVIATHLIGLAAHLNPGSALLGSVATGLHSLVASGAVLAERSAQEGLKRVGAGLALVRQELPTVAEKVTQYFDATTATNAAAQGHIAAGAAAAEGTAVRTAGAAVVASSE